jgi:cytoskeleton protein RodZ
MSSVGTYLRDLRQRKGVSLEEIARTTRVAQRYLESIEADAFEALPSRVFTRGFIRAYCQALGESPDEVLAAFEGRELPAPPVVGSARTATVTTRPGTAVAPARPGTQHAADVEARGRGAVLVSFVLLVVLGVALFAVALVIHPRDRSDRAAVETRPESSAVRESAEPTAAPVAAPPAVSAPVTPPSAGPVASTPRASNPSTPSSAPSVRTPASPSATPAAAPSTPAASSATAPPAPRPIPPAPTAPAAPATPPMPSASVAPPALDNIVGSVTSPYRLVARTNETTWIRVRTEDGRMSEENVPPGEVREWISNRPFVLTVGNAGGVSLELNGRALPPLGPKGLVIQRIVLPPEAR